MSSGNPNRGAGQGNEPPRPQVKYNLAALRLAQSSSDNQIPPIRVVSGAPPSAASAPAAASQTRGPTFASVVSGAASAPATSKTATATTAPAPQSTAALLAALHIGEDRPTPAAAAQAKASPPASTAPYTATTTAAAAPAAPAQRQQPSPPVPPQPRSSASSSSPHAVAATAAAPPTQANVPFRGPAPFSTALPAPQNGVPLPRQAAPFTTAGLSPQFVSGSDSGPSRRPMAMPMHSASAAAAAAPAPPMAAPVLPQPQPNAPFAHPQPQQAIASIHIPQPRRADPAYSGSAFVNPFHQGAPVQPPPPQPQLQQPFANNVALRSGPALAPQEPSAPSQPGCGLFAVPQPQQRLSPAAPAHGVPAVAPNIGAAPGNFQMARPPPPQSQQQQQQQHFQPTFQQPPPQQQPPQPQPQLQQQQPNRFVPAPRTQRESNGGARTIPEFPTDVRPLMAGPGAPVYTQLSPGAMPPVNTPPMVSVPPQTMVAPPSPPQQLPQSQPQLQQQQQPMMYAPPQQQQPLPMPVVPPQPQMSLPFQVPAPQSRGGNGERRSGAPTPTAAPATAVPASSLLGNTLTATNLYNAPAVNAAPAVPAPASAPTIAQLLGVQAPMTSAPANVAPATSTSPPAATAEGPSAPQNLDIQHVLQRMGIPAHLAPAPTTTTAPAATASAFEQLAQAHQQHQQQQQVPLNLYTSAGGGRTNANAQRPFNAHNANANNNTNARQQGYRQHQNGRGGGRQHYDAQSQPHGRGPAGLPGYAQQQSSAGNARAPPAPVTHLAAPDPETVQRFKDEYAQQEDAENVSEELKAQQASKLGTVGTLDEEVCLSLIESHDVTFVVTDTGTGKSTRIPIALHKAHPDALVVNAQPRRTAAINLAQRVAEVLGAKLGEEVGYSVRGEHIGDLGETKVMYVTTYSLFIYFLWHEFKEKLPFTYIIVDEFHERTPDVEVILLMLKLWLKKHPGAFKLILCSATAQVEEWHSFFDGLDVGTYARSPIMYPVREYFIEDLQRLVGFRTAPIAPQDSNNMVASEQMHQLILVCKQLLEYLAKNTATQDSVLVFMPGRTQVELMTTWIRDNLEESLEPVAWYRDVELSVIQEALARSAVTRKKVYVATDIAEVSLTLPDVVFVIDSGTGKRPQVSAKEQTSYAFPPLRLLWETASNAQQRRGRVGRVQQGFYFSLLSKAHHTALRETENRIKNAVLTELVLHSLLITQRPFAFFQLCNERPETGALSYSLHLLQDGGLIIGKDDPLAEAERVALDRQHTNHVMDSPWNALIEEALIAARLEEKKEPSPTAAEPADAADADAEKKTVKSDADADRATTNAAETKDDDEAVDDDDDDDDLKVPEAEVDAFQQCYYMTLRGVIAARSPVSVAAATNIFYGLLCGTPTLSMLAAAIESSKSPFHVPYTINDRVERAGMVRAVSQVMQRYHGSLQSDLICAMEVILEYMSMQRDGLSEEAQEEWCQERSVSRTRVVDTLNLFAQMKEQVSSVLPFPDVTDIDVLTAQFNQNAELLVLMLVASHTELAIQVQLDGPVAQKKGFVGHGMFFPLKCLKDESVPTVCPWDRTKISVPLSLQTIQRKVLAVFSSQVEPDLFALVVLVFSFKLRYTVLDGDATPSYLMSVSHSGVRRTFQCDVLTAQQILQLRRIQCAQLRCMQLQVEERVKASESEKLSALLKSANSDFGLPDSAMQTPYLIPTVLQHGLKLLVNRLRSSPSFTAQKRPISDFPAGTAYCKLQHGVELTVPILQSVLIHSSNGLSVVKPASSPIPAAAAEADKSGVAAEASATAAMMPLAAAAAEDMSKSAEEVDEDMSDKSSESSNEEHVATFRYDL